MGKIGQWYTNRNTGSTKVGQWFGNRYAEVKLMVEWTVNKFRNRAAAGSAPTTSASPKKVRWTKGRVRVFLALLVLAVIIIAWMMSSAIGEGISLGSFKWLWISLSVLAGLAGLALITWGIKKVWDKRGTGGLTWKPQWTVYLIVLGFVIAFHWIASWGSPEAYKWLRGNTLFWVGHVLIAFTVVVNSNLSPSFKKARNLMWLTFVLFFFSFLWRPWVKLIGGFGVSTTASVVAHREPVVEEFTSTGTLRTGSPKVVQVPHGYSLEQWFDTAKVTIDSVENHRGKLLSFKTREGVESAPLKLHLFEVK
ncbi:MAG: hypothetical protein AB200_00245 [Parcubacteria bacterium C7867-005]|nr:MAG: hypothetical protein AB200_00245 [Parcubacteria bacterium C7867-005]